MIDRSKLRDCVKRLHEGDDGGVVEALVTLSKLGAVRNVHVGKKGMVNGPDECVEWYAGQVVDALETCSLFAVNSICNALDRFVPEVAGE